MKKCSSCQQASLKTNFTQKAKAGEQTLSVKIVSTTIAKTGG